MDLDQIALLEIGYDVAAHQLDGIHDPGVGQGAHLHEAQDLIHSGLLISP